MDPQILNFIPMKQEKEFPFIFVYHGKPFDIYSFQGEKYFIFCFREDITEQIAEKIDKLAPKILSGSTLWGGPLYMRYSISEEDEITGYYLKKRKSAYDEEFSDELFYSLFSEFADDIEKWALSVNNVVPAEFFIGHNRIAGSKWDKFSDTKLSKVIERLHTLSLETNPRYKLIINEAAQQILQGKNHSLTAESKRLLSELVRSTS